MTWIVMDTLMSSSEPTHPIKSYCWEPALSLTSMLLCRIFRRKSTLPRPDVRRTINPRSALKWEYALSLAQSPKIGMSSRPQTSVHTIYASLVKYCIRPNLRHSLFKAEQIWNNHNFLYLRQSKMKYYTYFCPYLRCQIEYIFTLNRWLNCNKASLKSAKQEKVGSEICQNFVIYSLIWHCMDFAPTSNDLNVIVCDSQAVKLSCLPQTCPYYTIFYSTLTFCIVFFRPVQPFCLAISHEPLGFDESLVIQHEMADLVTLIYFLARLKWNIT